MRISTFCEKYKITSQAVYRKIKNHEKELHGHIIKDRKNVLDLDDYAIAFLKPERETYRTLDEQNIALSNQVKKLSDENETLREEIKETNKIAERLTFSNLEYEKKHDLQIAEIALLTKERDNLKTELSDMQKKLSELQSELSDEKENLSSVSMKWEDEKSAFIAEIDSLKLQLKSAEEQLVGKEEEKKAQNGGIMGIFKANRR